MAHYRFNYPKEFVTLPDYTAHAGQIVEVIRPAKPTHKFPDGGEYDWEGEAMFIVRASDGWEGMVWKDELVKVE